MLRRLKQQKAKKVIKPFNYKVVNNKFYLLGDGEDDSSNVLNISSQENLGYLSYDLINKIYYNSYSISPLTYADFYTILDGTFFTIYCLIDNNIYEYEEFLDDIFVNDNRYRNDDPDNYLVVYYNYKSGEQPPDAIKELDIDIAKNTAIYKQTGEDDVTYNFNITNVICNNLLYYRYEIDNSVTEYKYFKTTLPQNSKYIICYKYDNNDDFYDKVLDDNNIQFISSDYLNLSNFSLFEVNYNHIESDQSTMKYRFMAYINSNINMDVARDGFNYFNTCLKIEGTNYNLYLPHEYNYDDDENVDKIKPYYVISTIDNTYENIINCFNCFGYNTDGEMNFRPTYYNNNFSLTTGNLYDSTLEAIECTSRNIYNHLIQSNNILLKDHDTDLCIKFRFELLDGFLNPSNPGRIYINDSELKINVAYKEDTNTDFESITLNQCVIREPVDDVITFEFKYGEPTVKFTVPLYFDIKNGTFRVKSTESVIAQTQLITESKFKFDILFIQKELNKKDITYDEYFDKKYYTVERIKSIFGNKEPDYISPLFKQILTKNQRQLSSEVKDPVTIDIKNIKDNNIMTVIDKVIIRKYWNETDTTNSNVVTRCSDTIVVLNKDKKYTYEITKIQGNSINKSFTNIFHIPPSNPDSFITLLAWNEIQQEEVTPSDGEYLTFALDVKRNLFKFNNNVKSSSIKNLVSNYSAPDQPNNN